MSNQNRLNHFLLNSTPAPDHPHYEALKDHFLKNSESPKRKKEIKKKYNKAMSVVSTQLHNGIELLQDKELRSFLMEFNDRTWKYGFSALPAAFNILEGFFKWHKKYFFFELYEEQEHLFSTYDFFDFVTSNECSNNLDYFKDNVDDDLIYSYNILNNIKDLTFLNNDSKEYVIGGVSFIKRNSEIFLLAVVGELGDLTRITAELPEIDLSQGRSYIKPAEGLERKAEALLGLNDVWKVNIYAKIDVESMTIENRYIQKDVGTSYHTITDDINCFGTVIEDSNKFIEFMKSQLQTINEYQPLFDAVYHLLHLPQYFDHYDENILYEDHPTALFDQKRGRFKKPKLSSNHFYKTKEAWILDRKIAADFENNILDKIQLKFETEGYWKNLEPGKIGIGKNGDPIHNRTWVSKTLDWHELDTNTIDTTKVNISEGIDRNEGFIYLVRNAAHDDNIFKIGLTTKTVEERMKGLNGTSSPDNFLIVHRWRANNCRVAEKIIHSKLSKYRLNPKREFFRIDLELAVVTITETINELNNSHQQQDLSVN